MFLQVVHMVSKPVDPLRHPQCGVGKVHTRVTGNEGTYCAHVCHVGQLNLGAGTHMELDMMTTVRMYVM